MKNKLRISEIFYSLAGEGIRAGTTAIFIRLAGCNRRCSFCFGIKSGRRIPKIILASNRNKRITAVKAGDRLLTLNNNHKLVETTVREVLRRNVDEWYEIKINSRLYFVTPEHPFFTVKGICSAKELEVGDILYHINPQDKLSFRMRGYKNPIREPKIKAKKVRNTDYSKFGERTREMWRAGMFKIPPMTEINKKKASERMVLNNPMHNPETALRARNTLHDRYEKGEYKYSFEFPKVKEKIRLIARRRALHDNPMKKKDVVHRNFLSHKKRKSGYELRFEKLCHDAGLYNIQYIGDGKFPIGYKYPDFWVKGTHKLIEVYSSTYLYKGGHRTDSWITKRKKFFADRGYKTLFVDMDQRREDEILDRVKQFMHNGFIIEGIRHINRDNVDYKYEYRRPHKLSVLNFRCTPYNSYLLDYFWVHNCDTDYHERERLSCEEIYRRIKGYPCRSIIWTGGEPALQLTEDIVQFFKERNFYQAIETNGSLPIPDNLDFVTVSPKGRTVLKYANEIKIVVTDKTTKEMLLGCGIAAEHYLLSPQFDGMKLNRKFLKKAIELCLETGWWRLSIQQHKAWHIR